MFFYWKKKHKTILDSYTFDDSDTSFEMFRLAIYKQQYSDKFKIKSEDKHKTVFQFENILGEKWIITANKKIALSLKNFLHHKFTS
jgi:hypothetical protein